MDALNRLLAQLRTFWAGLSTVRRVLIVGTVTAVFVGLGAFAYLSHSGGYVPLNREPISVDVSYFPLAIGERLAQEDLAARDIFAILENDHRRHLTHADVQIEAISADELLARHLRVPEAAPLLRIERLTHADDEPIDFEFLFYRGDAFQYRLRIERS